MDVKTSLVAQSVFIPFVEEVKTRASVTPVKGASWCFERWETRYCFSILCLRGIEPGAVLGMGSIGTVLLAQMPKVGPVALRLTPLESWVPSSDCRVKKATETKTLEKYCLRFEAERWANELSVSAALSKLTLGPKVFAAWTCTAYDTDFPTETVVFGVMAMELVPGLTLTEYVYQYGWSHQLENALFQMLEAWKISGWRHVDLHGDNVMIQFIQSTPDIVIPVSARAIDVGDAKKRPSPPSKELIADLKRDVKHHIKQKMGAEFVLKF